MFLIFNFRVKLCCDMECSDNQYRDDNSLWLCGFVAWCEKKCSDEVLEKWSFVVDANGFNQVDV